VTVSVTIRPELQATLEMQARARGMTVDQYLSSVVESLASPQEYDIDALLTLPAAQQRQLVREAAELAAREYHVDLSLPADSRELTDFTTLDTEDFADESS
jgi:hypothetical protein